MVDEPIICVGSKEFVKQNSISFQKGQFYKLPHLLCERLYPDKILQKSERDFVFNHRFNDIATTKAACLKGAGWALLPRYTIKNEINDGQLMQLDGNEYGISKYGVWRLRNRHYLKKSHEILCEWLSKVEL